MRRNQTIRERGDDVLTLLLGVTADLLRASNLEQLEREKPAKRLTPRPGGEIEDPLTMLLDPSGPRRLKQWLAAQIDGKYRGSCKNQCQMSTHLFIEGEFVISC